MGPSEKFLIWKAYIFGKCIPDHVVYLHTSMQIWLVLGYSFEFEITDLLSFAISQKQINQTNRLKTNANL